MYNRKLVFYAACLGMLIFGIVMTTVGTILPSLIDKFSISRIDAGSLLFLMTLGMLAGSIGFGPIVDRFGYKSLLIICAGIIIIGLEGVALATSLGVLRIAVIMIGLGGGVINGGTNALVADISESGKSARLSYLGVFFGIGAFGVPFLMGNLITVISYESVIAGVGLVVLLPLLFFSIIRFPLPKHQEGFPLKEGLGLTKETVLLLMGLILFFESGLEMTAGGWTATYFKEELAVTASRAVIYLSIYWLGQMLARIVLGKLLTRQAPGLVLKVCLVIAIIGSSLCILTSNVGLAVFGVFLLGVGFAAGFPVILGFIGEIYPSVTGTAFSLVFTMALIGGMTLPYLTGVISHYFDFRISFILVPLSLVCMLVLLQVVLRKLPSKS
ncbi:MAG: MFS transporter [Candidatus Marinimicrobia bacterium]|nr:MFS transporter [Candidatus Neomarinimicrobiota bacterium]